MPESITYEAKPGINMTNYGIGMTRAYAGLRSLLISLLLLGASGTSFADPKASAAETVDRLHKTLLEVMQQADTLRFDGRVEKLTPTLMQSFDFETISRIVTGKHWRKIDDGQRGKFIDLFKKLSAATYASNFSGYSGEQFQTLEVEEKRGRYVVKSEIIKSDGEKVSLDYVVTNNDGMWQIVNVIAQGVSDLSLKRADYTAVINSEGFESLLNRLNDKIAHMQSNG